MKFAASENYSEEGSGFQAGPYFFKITRSESGMTKSGKAKLDIDIELFGMEDKVKVGKGIKYISFIPEVEQQKNMLSALCAVVGLGKGFDKESELVGKGGVVLVGWEESFTQPGEYFPKPAFGGFGAWFDRDKMSATELKSGSSEGHFMERLGKLIESPYRDVSGRAMAERPAKQAKSAPAPVAQKQDDSSDMPF